MSISKILLYIAANERMTKLCHVITPWRSGLGSNFGWFSESLNQALLTIAGPLWAYSPPSCPNLGIKMLRFGRNRRIFPRFWSRDLGVIGRPHFFKTSLRHNLDQYLQNLWSTSLYLIWFTRNKHCKFLSTFMSTLVSKSMSIWQIQAFFRSLSCKTCFR